MNWENLLSGLNKCTMILLSIPVKQIVSAYEKEVFVYSDIKYQKTDILRPLKIKMSDL